MFENLGLIISLIILLFGGYVTEVFHHNWPKIFPSVSYWIFIVPGSIGVLFFATYKRITKIIYKNIHIFFESQFKAFKLKVLMSSVLENMSLRGLPHPLPQKKKYEIAKNLITECKKEDEKTSKAAKNLWNEHWYNYHITKCLGILGKKEEQASLKQAHSIYTLKHIESMIKERQSDDSYYKINKNLSDEINILELMEKLIENGKWVDCPKEFQGNL